MATIITGKNDIKKVAAGNTVNWAFQLSSDVSEAKITFSLAYSDSENAPEWVIRLKVKSKTKDFVEVWSNEYGSKEYDADDLGKNPTEFLLEVDCPIGARYGDSVKVEMSVDGASMTYEAVAQQSIMILKSQVDQEKTVADDLANKVNALKNKDVYAILSPAGVRGYVFVEGMNTDRVHELPREIRKARAFVMNDKGAIGETDIEEIGAYLTPMSAVKGIVEGDIVELVNGPFKGEKARVQQIDQGKEEITVELIEAMVPIPVTVKGDSVRVIEKEK